MASVANLPTARRVVVVKVIDVAIVVVVVVVIVIVVVVAVIVVAIVIGQQDGSTSREFENRKRLDLVSNPDF